MLNRISLLTAVVVAATVALMTGCAGEVPEPAADQKPQTQGTPEATHDPHDIPLTEEEISQLKEETSRYEDAVEHIKSFRDTIRKETTEGTPAHAHRSLDKLDQVLQWLPGIARDSGVPRSKWEEVNTTARELRGLFDRVHANIDEGQDPDYAAVAEEIDRGIERLAAIEPEEAEKTE